MYDHEEDDTGGSPGLLRRHPSEMSFVHVPRNFDEEENAPPVARSETNVLDDSSESSKSFFPMAKNQKKNCQALSWKLCSRQCRP